jgi:V/A-type H+-transporting ATPase subunit B
MEKHVGAFKTREDHANLASQLITAYSEGKSSVEDISNFGKRALLERNLLYAKFANSLEKYFINQKADDYRLVDETLDLGWELLSTLPKTDLTCVPTELITRYMP